MNYSKPLFIFLRNSVVFGVIGFGGAATTGSSAAAQSYFGTSAVDSVVPIGGMPIIDVDLEGGKSFLFSADGAVVGSPDLDAHLSIRVDGKAIGSARLDWRGSKAPVLHGFRFMAASSLPSGRHHIDLYAVGSSQFLVSNGTALAVMASPASNFAWATLATPASVAVDQYPLKDGEAELLHQSILTVGLFAQKGSIVALAGGNAAHASSASDSFGDPMWSLWFQNHEGTAAESSYADNDICKCAELAAPLSVQGKFFSAGGWTVISLGAGAEPWGEGHIDRVRYTIDDGASLILLNGGMRVVGGSAVPPLEYARGFHRCIATSEGWTGCPMVGSDVTLADEVVSVPENHNGVVFFSAMTRLQGSGKDAGGEVELWLSIDGRRVGSVGRQGLSPLSGVSTRTMSSMWLADDFHSLSFGQHRLQLHVRAKGHFVHLSVYNNLPLIWFD